MKRSETTSERVNQLLSRDEPSFYGLPELTKIELIISLNWYQQNKDTEVSHKYLVEYCKENHIKISTYQVSSQPSTLGFLCRMRSRGAILDKKSLSWVENRLRDLALLTGLGRKDQYTEPKAPLMLTPPKVVTVQEKSKDKVSKVIGVLEGAIDEFILSDFKKTPNTLELMKTHNVKGAQGPVIVNFFKKIRDEFRVAIGGKDEQIREGYSNFTFPQLKKMEALYDQIVSDALILIGESLENRSPRKKKKKSPEAQTKSLKYCEEDSSLKLKSLPPTSIVGAQSVYLYNRKNRLLSVYVADDISGLSVKGSTLFNYTKTKSRAKKLRKPEEITPKVVEGGKVFLRNVMDNLTTKDSKLTGRLNKDTLILRVIAG